MLKRTGSLAVLSALLIAGASAAQAATLTVSSVSGAAGAAVSIDVILAAQGAMVAGTQNDITFDASAAIAAKANTKPNCTVNPDIDKAATSFAFRPTGCSAAGSTTPCTSIRALVLSTDNTTAIADGAVLYTCSVTIAADASGGDHTLAISGVILSDPNGVKVSDASGVNGKVTVEGGNPTATATAVPPTPVATAPTPKPPPAGPAIYVDDQEVTSGQASATITAKLAAGGAQVAGTQNDIAFPAEGVIAAKANTKPNCTVNGDIDKAATSFAFRPTGCSAAGSTTPCTSIRALVLSTDNTTAIPDGSVLYTCQVSLTATAGTSVAYGVTGVILSDPSGVRVADASGQDGSIFVAGVEAPTATPTMAEVPTDTPTSPPVATATEPPPPTATRPASTATPTTKAATATPTRTRTPGATSSTDEDGCQIASHGSTNGWMLLIPALGFLAMRRRSR